MTEEQVAASSKISEATVRRWVRLKRARVARAAARRRPEPTARSEPVQRGAGSRGGEGRPYGPGDRLGVPPTHGPERQPVFDEPGAAEARAHTKTKSLTAM
jgi:hypothetical protein